MACTGIFSNPAATGADTLWNYFNLFYHKNYPNDGGVSSVFGIAESGRYVQKLSQFQPDGTFVEDGICPFESGLDTFDYNYKSPHDDVMLSNETFSTPNGLFGILETNSKHSCLQDIDECGGELWCNKIFFPRRSYKGSNTYLTPGYNMEPPYPSDESYINGDGTLITAFGANAICQSNVEFGVDTRYHGWGINGQFKPYVSTSDYAEPDYIKYEITQRYFDPCDDKVLTEVFPYDVGIDDSRVSVRDYLPLIGVVHPGWRSTVASKSCVILSSGCGFYALPTHTDQSIRVGSFAPKTWSTNRFDSMGYYLDKAGDGRFNATGVSPEFLPYRNEHRASGYGGQPLLPLTGSGAAGDDNCLFNPFKILVDVECSTNRFKRQGVVTDEPTSLNFISQVPGAACSGLRQNPPCGCTLTNCFGNFPPHRDAGEPVYELKAQWKLVDVAYGSGADCPALTGDEKGIYETSGLVPSTVVLGRGVEIAASNGVWRDGTIDFDGIAGSGNCAGGTFDLDRPLTDTGIYVYLKDASCNAVKDYVYEVANTVDTVMWDCTNNLYVSNAKDGPSADPCVTENGLCNAKFRFPLPLQCDKAYIENGITEAGTNVESKLVSGGFTGIYNEHPTTGWFVSDCGCSFLQQQDSECTNSIVKMTITE
jgi:hypothetical protein